MYKIILFLYIYHSKCGPKTYLVFTTSQAENQPDAIHEYNYDNAVVGYMRRLINRIFPSAIVILVFVTSTKLQHYERSYGLCMAYEE